MKTDNSKIKNVFKDMSFSPKEISIIENVFHKVTFKKGDLIIKVNDSVEYQYYTLDGCLRSFYTDEEGKEHTIQFAICDWWISDFTAFFSDSNAILNIETLRDSVLYRISKEDKELLYKEIPKIESFFRLKLERAFSAFQKRILSNISKPASERYMQFRKTYPNIERCVKNYHIASYLGITTESLSRIRKELASK